MPSVTRISWGNALWFRYLILVEEDKMKMLNRGEKKSEIFALFFF